MFAAPIRPAPRLPGPVGDLSADGEGVRVMGAEDLADHRQQRLMLGQGLGCISRPTRQMGEIAAEGQGVGMSVTQDPPGVGDQVSGVFDGLRETAAWPDVTS
jgi:hypothetical protein